VLYKKFTGQKKPGHRTWGLWRCNVEVESGVKSVGRLKGEGRSGEKPICYKNPPDVVASGRGGENRAPDFLLPKQNIA
jgi:hypothetical protein